MATKWTNEQQQVIDLRNRNILVSAAAGSGKTAVLVERIIKIVTDEEKPVDIDRILVVTFTNAAAAEMRERISKALETAQKENPNSTHLERQLTLIHNSQITTIDSFCLYLLRNYFERIDLDPTFRIADENELKLMQKDIAKKVLEEAYEEKTESFVDFVESFATGKRDDALLDYIIKLYSFSMSHHRPKQWLDDCMETYNIHSEEAFSDSFFIKGIVEDCKIMCSQLLEDLKCALQICEEIDGPASYIPMITEDMEQLERFLSCGSFGEIVSQAKQLHFTNLKAARDVDESLKKAVQTIRKESKEAIEKYCKRYFLQDAESLVNELELCGNRAGELVNLTKKFMEAFAEEKREKCIVDFSDVEHFALEILMDEQGRPTKIAEEFSEYFEEIMIDEYQDSNQVQELLLSSMKKKDRNNLFMVGDVKQSIYKFRLARPELFMDKLENYSEDESKEQKIVLSRNFRSRHEVLDSVNFLFCQIMRKELGEVAYNKAAALYPGAVYPESEKQNFDTELMLVDSDLEMEGLNEKELQARAVAEKILEITNPDTGIFISNEKRDGFRRAKLSDVVVLFRTLSGWTEPFVRIFEQMGVPVRAETSSGFFATSEVQTVLSILHILDNPRQDIPLALVLKAPFVGFSNEELARIRTIYPEGNLYESLEQFIIFGKVKREHKVIEEKQALLSEIPDELIEKADSFMQWFLKLRSQVMHNSVSKLLQIILEETKYPEIARALPGGEQKCANIMLLLEKARDFEKTSYHGLFHFLRYMEQIQRMDVDFGEASYAENLSQVRFMSIHKSKGLEFPIVFVVGMEKSFNKMDLHSKVVLHPDYGIGMDYVDINKRWKRPTVLKSFIQDKLLEESLGEELRVLYVALTRAKEKLYLYASGENLAEQFEKLAYLRGTREEAFSKYRLLQANNYLTWVFYGLLRSNEAVRFAMEDGCDLGESGRKNPYPEHFQIHVVSLIDQLLMEMKQQVEDEVKTEDFIQRNKVDFNLDDLEEVFRFTYPYEPEREIPSTISVTELKKRANAMREDEETQLFEEKVECPYIPEFMKEEKKIAGNIRGNAYHHVMECLDFTSAKDIRAVEEQMQNLLKRGILSEEEVDIVAPEKICDFVNCSAGQRMRMADEKGKLHREAPFVMGLSAKELGYEVQGEPVLVQGIIDVYFEEEDGLVVLDYKTDRVFQAKELIDRYRTQLKLYSTALERATGKQVKECIIYSFHLVQEIALENEK